MTPLIDIVFLLLIFFMVMTRFDEEDYKLDVVLPSASEAQPLMAKPREIFINIDEQGQFFVRGNQITLEALEEMLEHAGADNPSGSVVIRADKNGRLEYSVLVMNACNKAGLTNYSISTAPVDPS
ncbi:MAG: biopolymer transporter ExbD [Pirellulaceae bacterium]